MANQPKRYKKFVATAATATLVASAIAPVASASFKDVADNNDHKKNIEAIAELGYMGAGDNFRPSENVTRGQVAIILANWAQDVAGLEVPADYKDVQRFKDVPLTADDKLLQSAALVKEYGIFEGSNGNLNGASPISREHMALVLNKAYEAVTGTSLVELAGDTSDVTFADEASINKDYLHVVKALKKLGITAPASFNPKGSVTRGQFASFFVQTVNAEEPVDETELKVESVSAINAKQLEVKFNKAVDKKTVIEDSGAGKDTLVDGLITLSNLGTAPAVTAATNIDGAKAELSADGKTLKFTIAGSEYMNGDYVLNIAKDRILSSDKSKLEYLGEYTSSVITMKDKVEPKVTSVERVTATQYKLVFSEPINLTGSISAKYTSDGKEASNVTIDDTDKLKGELLVNFDGGVTENKEMTITLTGAADFNGNLLSGNPYSFKATKLSADGVAPEVKSITVLNPNKLEIKFSEEVVKFDPNKVSINGAPLSNADDKVEKDKTDKTKITITLKTGLSNGFHTLAIGAGDIVDMSGEGIEAYSKVFEVKEDKVAPKLTSSKITKDGRDGKEYLVVTFDKDVTLDKINKTNMAVTGGTGLAAKRVKDYVTVSGTIKVKDASAGFVPTGDDIKNEYKVALADLEFEGASLDKDARYTLDLPASAVKNLTGTASDKQGSAITFTRGSDSVVTGQEVVKVVSNIDSTDAGDSGKDAGLANNKLTVVFAKEVDGASATNTANYTVDGAVVSKAELAADKVTVTLTLEKDKTTYTGARYVTINNVKTKSLENMKEAFRKALSINENIAPTVSGVSVTAIADNAGNSDYYDVTVRLTFSEAVSNATADNDFEVLLNGTANAAATATLATEIVAGGAEKKTNEVTFTILKSDFDSKKVEFKALSTINIIDAVGNKLSDSTKVTVKE